MHIRNIKNKYTFLIVVYYFQPISDVVYYFQPNSSAVADISCFWIVISKKRFDFSMWYDLFQDFYSKSIDFTSGFKWSWTIKLRIHNGKWQITNKKFI